MEFAGLIAFAVLLVAAAGVGDIFKPAFERTPQGANAFSGSQPFGSRTLRDGVNFAGIRMSRRSSLAGVIGGLRQSHGKGSSSSFYVWGADRRWRHVHCDYNGNRLINGETVAVDLLDFHSTLIHLTVLDGPYSGWSLTEGDGTIGSTFAVGFGLFLIFAARAKWQRDPDDSEVRYDGRIPLIGVDEDSLLHLSRSEKDAE